MSVFWMRRLAGAPARTPTATLSQSRARTRVTATEPAPSGPADQQQIRRAEAKGGVVVTQKDQTATGDIGIFDARANTVTFSRCKLAGAT